jgi:hypothetical protein
MKKVLELQLSLWRSWNFKTYPILFVLHSYFEHYKQGGVVIQFHTKKFVHMGWTNKKCQPKKKNKLCTFLKFIPSQPTYLPS